MRVVLDTNIIVSAPIGPAGKPAAIIDAWLDGKFTLPTCAAHVDELRATLQKPRVAGRPANPQEARRGHRSAAVREALSRSHGRFSSGPVGSGQRRLSGHRPQDFAAVAA